MKIEITSFHFFDEIAYQPCWGTYHSNNKLVFIARRVKTITCSLKSGAAGKIPDNICTKCTVKVREKRLRSEWIFVISLLCGFENAEALRSRKVSR